jgi:hypothetical protein
MSGPRAWTGRVLPGARLISRARAEGFARTAIGAPPAAPTFSRLLAGLEAVKRFGPRKSTINEARPVWVVTVRAPVRTDGGPGTKSKLTHAYSVIIDAATGKGTDDCIGCRWIDGPGPASSGGYISQSRILSIAMTSAAGAGDPSPTLIQHSTVATRTRRTSSIRATWCKASTPPT